MVPLKCVYCGAELMGNHTRYCDNPICIKKSIYDNIKKNKRRKKEGRNKEYVCKECHNLFTTPYGYPGNFLYCSVHCQRMTWSKTLNQKGLSLIEKAQLDMAKTRYESKKRYLEDIKNKREQI